MATNYLYGVQGNIYDPAMFQMEQFRNQSKRYDLNQILQDIATRPGQLKTAMGLLQGQADPNAKFGANFDQSGKFIRNYEQDAEGNNTGKLKYADGTTDEERNLFDQFNSGAMGTGYGSQFFSKNIDLASLAGADNWAGPKVDPRNPYGYNLSKDDKGNTAVTLANGAQGQKADFSFDQDYNVVMPGNGGNSVQPPPSVNQPPEGQPSPPPVSQPPPAQPPVSQPPPTPRPPISLPPQNPMPPMQPPGGAGPSQQRPELNTMVRQNVNPYLSSFTKVNK